MSETAKKIQEARLAPMLQEIATATDSRVTSSGNLSNEIARRELEQYQVRSSGRPSFTISDEGEVFLHFELEGNIQLFKNHQSLPDGWLWDGIKGVKFPIKGPLEKLEQHYGQAVAQWDALINEFSMGLDVASRDIRKQLDEAVKKRKDLIAFKKDAEEKLRDLGLRNKHGDRYY